MLFISINVTAVLKTKILFNKMNFKLITLQIAKIQTSEDQHNFFEQLILSSLQEQLSIYTVSLRLPLYQIGCFHS